MTKITCLNLDCPERKGGRCNAKKRLWKEIMKNVDVFKRLANK